MTLAKPRLLFFRWSDPSQARFIQQHLAEHVKCLSYFFDVTVITENCDYDKACDQHQPDVVLIESGIYSDRFRRELKNISAHPQVPKIGLCNSDAMCTTRASFLYDMARWNVDTYFTISVSMPEYTPEVGSKLFVWPNAIDADLFQDYGERKHIPVLFTGSQAPHYPWRNAVYKSVAQVYPTMLCPHFGWGKEHTTSRMISGEQYARLLNASWVVPSCGTVAKDIVRKHFEVPGSRACLVTERTAAAEAAGFVDGENCIFASEADVVEKLDFLFANRDNLQRIIDNGYEFVRSHHTLRHRDQIFRWLVLHKQLKGNQNIVQSGPFGELTIAGREAGGNSYVVSGGTDRKLLMLADKNLVAGEYNAAKTLYSRALNYLPYLTDAKLGLVLCNLQQGNSSEALKTITELLKAFSGVTRSSEPDPIEWGHYILVLVCKGKIDEAFRLAIEFDSLRHEWLDWIRLMVEKLANRLVSVRKAPPRASIHSLPLQNSAEWLKWVCSMLKSCGQSGLADQLRRTEKVRGIAALASLVDSPTGAAAKGSSRSQSSRGKAALILSDRSLVTRVIPYQLRKLAKSILRAVARPIEKRYGYCILPYAISAASQDPLFAAIEALAREEATNSILILGAKPGEGATEACLAGCSTNRTAPVVFFVTETDHAYKNLQGRNSGWEYVVCDSNSIDILAEKHGVSRFGMVIAGRTDRFRCEAFLRQIRSADLLVLTNISTPDNQELYQELLQGKTYGVDAVDPAHRNGFAIFRKRSRLALERDRQPALMTSDRSEQVNA